MLKRDQQQAQYDVRKNELELQRIQRETAFQIENLKNDFLQQKERINNDQKIHKEIQDFQIESMRKAMEMDKCHDKKTLMKYQVDATERIYKRMDVSEIRVNQFGSGNSTHSLGSILPQLNTDGAK